MFDVVSVLKIKYMIILFRLQGHRVEEKPCPASAPCPKSKSKNSGIATSSNVGRFDTLVLNPSSPDFYNWRPLFTENTISPCACGCIYIVGKERTVGITSAADCSASPFPLRWKVKVRKDI
jgi:hypothetical protein